MLSIRKNPVKLRKTITIQTQADALAYFQADDEATQAEHVQACKSNGQDYFVNTLTGEMVEIGEDYRL